MCLSTIKPTVALIDEIAAHFNDARALWQVFRRPERLPADNPATSETRRFRVGPFLRLPDGDVCSISEP